MATPMQIKYWINQNDRAWTKNSEDALFSFFEIASGNKHYYKLLKLLNYIFFPLLEFSYTGL